jgi:hypothetical protein
MTPRISADGPQRVVIRSPRLGVVNVMGPEAVPLMGEDLNALAPLFGKATESDSEPPRCDVLIVYARIDPSGKIAHSSLGLREMARDSGAKVVVATETSSARRARSSAG